MNNVSAHWAAHVRMNETSDMCANVRSIFKPIRNASIDLKLKNIMFRCWESVAKKTVIYRDQSRGCRHEILSKSFVFILQLVKVN